MKPITCNECKFYDGDAQQGQCNALPPKVNMALIDADWTEDQLLAASVRPMVMATDYGCTFGSLKR